MHTGHSGRLLAVWLIAVIAGGAGTAGCKTVPEWERGKKILHYPIRAKIGSLDPVVQSSTYDTMSRAQVYETLFSYKYLVQPLELRPLLAAAMPTVSDDKTTYTIDLERGVTFHDNPCFESGSAEDPRSDRRSERRPGQGREVVAQDVVYSLMRMADRDLKPGGWWLYRDRIVGFDEFRQRMQERPPGAPFDWDAEISGLRATDRYQLTIQLKRPFPQFLFILAMTYSAVVPRECAEYYGDQFALNPVGTGPFRLRQWIRGSRLIYERNPEYREEYYPTEASPEMKQRGLLAAAGQRVPFLDGLVFHLFEQDQPMWLKFRVGDLDVAQVPSEYQPIVYDENLELRQQFRDEGVDGYNLPLLDLIYRGFNMEDPLVGKGEKATYLRKAIAAATDTGEINRSFYNSAATLYDGPIPRGLAGHRPGVTSDYRGPNLELARELLARAGYPGGKGLPVLNYETSRSGNIPEQTEMYLRQLAAVGIQVEGNLNSFPELQKKLIERKAQMFGLAWNADYPDAENFLQLFYGPNETPGSNNFNYKNPEFDRLYDAIRAMEPGPERTAIYQEMRQIIIDDAPMFGNMSRIRFYLWNQRVKNILPAEVWHHWFKFVDVEI